MQRESHNILEQVTCLKSRPSVFQRHFPNQVLSMIFGIPSTCQFRSYYLILCRRNAINVRLSSTLKVISVVCQCTGGFRWNSNGDTSNATFSLALVQKPCLWFGNGLNQSLVRVFTYLSDWNSKYHITCLFVNALLLFWHTNTSLRVVRRMYGRAVFRATDK